MHLSTTRALMLALLVPVACGDEATEPTVSATQVSTVTHQTSLDTKRPGIPDGGPSVVTPVDPVQDLSLRRET